MPLHELHLHTYIVCVAQSWFLRSLWKQKREYFPFTQRFLKPGCQAYVNYLVYVYVKLPKVGNIVELN